MTWRFLKKLTQRLTHFQSAIVIDVSLLSEPIHEEIDSRARRSDHLRQNLVIQNGNLNSGPAILIQVREPHKHTREALFRRGGQQVGHMVVVVLDGGQQITDQRIRRFVVLAKQTEHLFLFDRAYGTSDQGDGRGRTKWVAR